MEMENRLGAYLKEKREHAELSQGDVARRLGYSTAQYISNFERGVCQPSLKIIARLAKMYRVDLKELFDIIMAQQHYEISKVLFKKPLSGLRKNAKQAMRKASSRLS